MRKKIITSLFRGPGFGMGLSARTSRSHPLCWQEDNPRHNGRRRRDRGRRTGSGGRHGRCRQSVGRRREDQRCRRRQRSQGHSRPDRAGREVHCQGNLVRARRGVRGLVHRPAATETAIEPAHIGMQQAVGSITAYRRRGCTALLCGHVPSVNLNHRLFPSQGIVVSSPTDLAWQCTGILRLLMRPPFNATLRRHRKTSVAGNRLRTAGRSLSSGEWREGSLDIKSLPRLTARDGPNRIKNYLLTG